MDLIRWILLFFDSLRMRRPTRVCRNIGIEIPMATATLVPVRAQSGRRLPRGPNLVNRRSDL